MQTFYRDRQVGVFVQKREDFGMRKWLKKALVTLMCALMGTSAVVGMASCDMGGLFGEGSHAGSVSTESNAPESTATESTAPENSGSESNVPDSNDPEHVHTWEEKADAQYMVSEATCTALAVYNKSCKDCGEAGTETFTYGAMADHVWVSNADAKYLVSEATCQAFAVYNKSCETCGTAGTETFNSGDLGDHQWAATVAEEWFVSAANCENPDTYAEHCTLCGNKGATFTDGEALGHNYVKTTIEPSCFVDGFDSYTCDRCDHTYADVNSVVKAPGEHTYTTVVTDPTCTAQGYTTYTCICGDSYVADYTNAEHDYTVTTVEPTCSTQGYTLHTCADCGDNYKDGYVAVTSHTYTRELVKAATCAEEGMYNIVFTCACGKVEEEPIPKTKHVYAAGTPVEPTCTEKGYTTYSCICGDSYVKDFVEARGHYFVEGETMAATCTDAGYTEYACLCGDSYRVETAALGHAIVTEWTLVVDGDGNAVLTQVDGCNYQKTYTNACDTCGAAMEKFEDVIKHNYAATITRVATCQDAGIKTFTCTVCFNRYDEDYFVAFEDGHQWSAPESTGGVEIVYCMAGCGEEKTTFKAEGTDVNVSKDVLKSTDELQMDAATIKMDEKTRNQLSNANNINLHASTLNPEDKDAVMSQLSEAEQAKLANKPIYNFTINDGATTQFEGFMTITVPYDLEEGEDADAIYVWYLNGDGLAEEIPATYTVIDGKGYAVFQTNHFSSYTIVRLTPSERCAKYGHDSKTRKVDATCEADGYYLEYCIRCGYNNTVEVYPATGHNYTDSVKYATCTEQGYTSHYCSTCNKTYVDSYVDALGHDYYYTSHDVTCTTPGYEQYDCGRCGHSYQNVTEDALGHNYEATVVDATCQIMGHTKKTCTICGSSYNENYTPKTDHVYTIVETVDATCSAKGYTRYTCEYCGAHYDDNFVGKVDHVYTATAVDPTCTAKGYTLYTCEDCGDSYKANYVTETGHKYGADYKCEVCGADHPAVNHGTKSFYITLRESVINATSYLITVDSFEFDRITKENGVPSDKQEMNCEVIQFTFGFDDDGYLVGYGEIEASMHYFEYEDDEYVSDGVETATMNVIFKDGKMYGFSKMMEEGSEDYVSYIVAPQDYITDNLSFPMFALRTAYLKMYSENSRAILAAAMGITDKQIDSALGAIIEFVFLKTDTGNGYTFTLNADQIYSVVEKLAQRSTKELIDNFFGTGTYNKIFERIHEVLDMTVGEFEAQIETRLNAAGYTIDDLYDVTNYAFGMVFAEASHIDEMDMKALIAEYKDNVIGEMLADATDKELDWIHNVINKLQAMCENRSIVSALLEMSGQAPNADKAEKMVDDLLAQVKKYLPYLGGTEITLTTNKSGEASAMTIKLDIELENFGGMMSGSNSEIGGIVIERTNSVVIKLDGTITFNESYESTFGDLAGELEALFNKLTLTPGQTVTRWGTEYVVYTNGADIFFVEATPNTLPNVNNAKESQYLGKDVLDGVEYDKYIIMYGYISSDRNNPTYSNEEVYYYCKDFTWMLDGTCGDWAEYSLNCNYGRKYYTVWATEDGTVVHYELNFEAIKENYNHDTSFYFWYNTVTGELMGEDPHNYVLVDRYEEGEGCDKTVTEVYECTGCGATNTSSSNSAHNVRETVELVEGATSCEDGWRYVYRCLNCDYVSKETNIHTYHESNRQTILVETDCGYVEFYTYSCACGYHNEWKNEIYFNGGDCQMEEYRGDMEFDENGFPIVQGGGIKYHCTKCGVVIEIIVETSDSNSDGKYEKSYSYETKVDVNISDILNGSGMNGAGVSKPEVEKPEVDYPSDGGEGKPEDGYRESCYQTGSLIVKANGVVVYEKSYTAVQHRYTNWYNDYEDGYRVEKEVCDCGEIVYMRKYDDNGNEVYYVDANGKGYRVEYNGCERTTIYFDKNGDYHTETEEAHRNYQQVVSLPWFADSCLDGIIVEMYCSECGEYVGMRTTVPDEHYFGSATIKEFATPCGTIYVQAYICACGQNTMFENIQADGCDLSYIQNETEMGAVCTVCGSRVMATAEYIVDGCTTTVNVTGGAYVNNTQVWSFVYSESYVQHSMNSYHETTEDGGYVEGYKCMVCGKLEYERTVDAYGREIRYVHSDGSGWYVEFDGCYETRYYFDENGRVYDNDRYENHTWGHFYEFMTDEKDCEAGVWETYGCLVCGETQYRNGYYHHMSGHNEMIVTMTPCGEIRLYGKNCACGYVAVEHEGLWVEGGCAFECTEDNYTWDEETQCETYKRVYVCGNCGYTYTVERYAERTACELTKYLVYTFGDGEQVFTYQHTTEQHEWRDEQGGKDDGTYLYERYCRICGTWDYHYEERHDSSGRQVYYMDRLAGTGWERVYGDDCTYTEYTLDQAGNRLSSTTGVQHAGYRDRYELAKGATSCEEGVIYNSYCISCGYVEHSYTTYGHNSFTHIEEFESHCGTVYVKWYGCACGAYVETYFDVYGACDFWGTDGSKWPMTYQYSVEHYACYITDCTFHYAKEWRNYYEDADSCLETYEVTFYLYDGNTLLFKKTGTSKGISHRWEEVTTYEPNGVTKVVRTCRGCGIQRIEKYDRYGRQIYCWDGEEGRGWMREFTGCEYYETGFDIYGNRWDNGWGIEHVWRYGEHIKHSCTQFETWITYCLCCGEKDYYEYGYVGHNYEWHDELGIYICSDCGLENKKGIDGNFIAEDLTRLYYNEAYKAGFFNKLGEFWEMEDGYNFYIVLNYGMETEVVTNDVLYEVLEYGYDQGWGAGSGIITLDMETLNAAITAAYGENWEGFENVSIVFQIFDRNEYGAGSYVDHVLTFSRI